MILLSEPSIRISMGHRMMKLQPNRLLRNSFIHFRRYSFVAIYIFCLGYLSQISPSALAAPYLPQSAVQDDSVDNPNAGLSPATKKFREMAEPKAKEKAKADLERPPFEFLRSQIAPFDVLPFYKQNHWMMMTVEARSSREDFRGSLQTQPLSLFGSQRDVIFQRPISMDRNTPTRMSSPLFVPPRYMPQRVTKIFDIDLFRENALRPTEIWKANVRAMEPHQMAVIVLARDPSTYNHINKYVNSFPSSISHDSLTLERGRYYRFVLPDNPEKPLLAPSFLFWTGVSHVIWDGFDPNQLDVDQQRAIVDWLHWGGQLVIAGGADSRLGLLRESVLGPYLPADLGGTNKQLDFQALIPLAVAYRPPYRPTDTINEDDRAVILEDSKRAAEPDWKIEPGPQSLYYENAMPILPLTRSPVFVSGLKPKPGATVLPLGTDKSTTLAVEWRVGRGRVTMLAISPTDPALVRWRGMDTLMRRVALRRPEEVAPPPRTLGFDMARSPMLKAPELTWLRITARDAGGPHVLAKGRSEEAYNAVYGPTSGLTEDAFPDEEATTWIDFVGLPRMAREHLEKASGFSIPRISFVAKSLLFYLIVLVPVNWLIFRAMGRRELAWLATPLLALLFAFGIERMAAYDIGFARGRDEIGVLELQGDYSRGHLTRLGALASTGRDTFTIGFPNDLNAVCLPLAYSASRAEQVQTSKYNYMPYPSLSDFQVQPRSLSYYRSEQMVSLPGPIQMVENGEERTIENRTKLALRQVVVQGPGGKSFDLGDIGPGESRALGSSFVSGAVSRQDILGKLDPEPFLTFLRENPLGTIADQDTWRLTGWSESVIEGVEVTPATDRVRGFTIVVANLKSGPPPDPDSGTYNIFNRQAAPPNEADQAMGGDMTEEMMRIHAGIVKDAGQLKRSGSGRSTARNKRALP